MRPSHILTAFVTLSGCVSAWPYPQSLVGPLEKRDALYGRQDNSNNNNNNNNNGENAGNGGNGDGNGGNTPAPNADATPTSDPTITTPPESDRPSETPSGDATGSESPAATDSSNGSRPTGSDNANATITDGPSSTPTKLASVNPEDPAAGLSMISPDPFSGSVYYRLGQTITWQWNYTYLLRPPSHINILATTSGTSAGQAPPTPFTIASNYSFAPTETFTWDTAKFTEKEFLPMGTYTLIVYDADAPGGVTGTPRPGYLGTWQQFYFGLYAGQARSDLPNPYICATCNAAGGQMERLTLSFLFGTFLVTAGSFWWFAGPVAGLL